MSKKDFRADCLKRLNGLNPSTRYYRDARVRSYLENMIKALQPKTVLLYWPLGLEADIRKSIHKFRSNKKLFLPFMDGVSFKMVPLRLPLERKSFGIFEPRNSYRKYNLIDVAIVPVIGVDGSLRRVGFGKGMYDRFFPTLKTKPYTIFIQSCRCSTSEDICDDYDVQGDLLITSQGTYSLRKTHVKRTSRWGRGGARKRVRRFFNFKKDYSRQF